MDVSEFSLTLTSYKNGTPTSISLIFIGTRPSVVHLILNCTQLSLFSLVIVFSIITIDTPGLVLRGRIKK